MNNQPIQPVILDASALITLFTKEKGHEIVESILTRSIMGSVNVSEVAKFLIDQYGVDKEKIPGTIQSLIDQIIPFDTKLAFMTADIVLKTKSFGLSLGDRACISLGLSTGYPIYTADKIWAKLDLGCEIILIR
jgi:PIN domain nuclease of toxin-antitoxin system